MEGVCVSHRINEGNNVWAYYSAAANNVSMIGDITRGRGPEKGEGDKRERRR
jgi:hypothetical protein